MITRLKLVAKLLFGLLVVMLLNMGCSTTDDNGVRVREKFNSDWKFINEDE